VKTHLPPTDPKAILKPPIPANRSAKVNFLSLAFSATDMRVATAACRGHGAPCSHLHTELRLRARPLGDLLERQAEFLSGL